MHVWYEQNIGAFFNAFSHALVNRIALISLDHKYVNSRSQASMTSLKDANFLQVHRKIDPINFDIIQNPVSSRLDVVFFYKVLSKGIREAELIPCIDINYVFSTKWNI